MGRGAREGSAAGAQSGAESFRPLTLRLACVFLQALPRVNAPVFRTATTAQAIAPNMKTFKIYRFVSARNPRPPQTATMLLLVPGACPGERRQPDGCFVRLSRLAQAGGRAGEPPNEPRICQPRRLPSRRLHVRPARVAPAHPYSSCVGHVGRACVCVSHRTRRPTASHTHKSTKSTSTSAFHPPAPLPRAFVLASWFLHPR